VSDLNETLNVLDRFSKNPQISNFMKIRTVAAELLHADKNVEDKNRFSQFGECT